MTLQSEKSCNFIEFTDMMHRLLKAAWGDDWGSFFEAFPNGRDPERVKLPVITYRILQKLPGTVGSTTREVKPRFRRAFDMASPVEGGPEVMNIYSQVFDYQVMFEIWHENNTKADELAERFEEFMMTYTGYMMSQGVGQILFEEMTGDDGSYQLRDKAVRRNYRYRVRLEKHIEVPSDVIKAVIVKVSVTTNLEDDQDQNKEAIDFKLE